MKTLTFEELNMIPEDQLVCLINETIQNMQDKNAGVAEFNIVAGHVLATLITQFIEAYDIKENQSATIENLLDKTLADIKTLTIACIESLR